MKRGVDYIGVGIGAVVVNSQNKFLLSKRGPKAQNERGKWELPGGALEFGENFEKTIVREMNEEFGIEVKPLVQLPVINHLIPDDHQHWVAVGYIVLLMHGTPVIKKPEKSLELGWFSFEEMKQLDLTIVAQERVRQIETLYPQGLPNFYKEA